MAPLARFQVRAVVAALIVFAAMAVAALLLYAPKLGLLGCAAPSAKQLYSGPPPRRLVIDMDVGSVQVKGDPRATETSIVLHYCGSCVHWDVERSGDTLVVHVHDTCGVHVGFGSSALLQVAIPEPRGPQSLNITLHVGSIELRNVNTSRLSLRLNVGSIEARNVSVTQNLVVETSTASAYLSNVFLPANATAVLRTSVGSIRLRLATRGAHVVVPGGERVGSLDNTCPEAPGPRVIVYTHVGSVRMSCRASG